MSSSASFDDLMDRLRAADQDAARELLQRFWRRLVALARSRMDRQIRQKEDPEDIVQSVFKSFFARYADREFDVTNWDDLWSMLVVITLRKCGHRVEHYRAACRDVRREAVALVGSAESSSSWQAIARDPTPSEAVMLAETLEHLMRALDERERKILALRLQGYSSAEIAPQVGRTERTVRLVLERVRKQLRRMRDEGPATA